MQHKYRAAFLLLPWLVLASACREEILHDLEELDANAVRVALDEHGIAAQKIRSGNGWVLTVSSDQAIDALALVDAKHLVRRKEVSSYEPEGGFIKSRDERRHQQERATGAALEQTLESIPGVREARVHLTLRSGVRPSEVGTAAGSASVLLVTNEESTIERSEVQRLVSGAAGIDIDKVLVVRTYANTSNVTRNTASPMVRAHPEIPIQNIDFLKRIVGIPPKLRLGVGVMVVIGILTIVLIRRRTQQIRLLHSNGGHS